MQLEILEGDDYHEVAAQTIDKVAFCGKYAKWCHAVGALERNPDLAHEMLKSVRYGSSVLLHMLTTIKTHKAQGKVEHSKRSCRYSAGLLGDGSLDDSFGIHHESFGHEALF